MRTRSVVLVATLALAMPVAGCGGDDDEDGGGTAEQPAQQAPAPVELPSKAEVQRDPTILTCDHLSDPVASSDLSRGATVALADELLERNAEFARENSRLQTSQRIFFAMTELCKGADPGFRPAEKAVREVEAGRFEADF